MQVLETETELREQTQKDVQNRCNMKKKHIANSILHANSIFIYEATVRDRDGVYRLNH